MGVCNEQTFNTKFEALVVNEGEIISVLGMFSDGGNVEEPKKNDYITDLNAQQTTLANTLQKAGVEADENEVFSTLIPKNEKLVEELSAYIGIDEQLAGLSNGGGAEEPTTADYVNDLTTHKNSLAETLQNSGVEASTEETFSTLVPKANEKIATSKDYLEDKITGKLTHYENKNVTTVSESAFNNMYTLESVSLPNVVTFEGGSQFYGCGALKSVNLPLCENLSVWAFLNCSNLESVSFPNLVHSGGTWSGGEQFSGCQKLHTFRAPKLTYVSAAFLSGTAITDLDLPNVTDIGRYPFQNCKSLITAKLPQVSATCGNTFNGCTSLTTIEFGSEVDTLKIYADDFKNCKSLKNVTLARNLITYDNINFSYSTQLTLESAKHIINALVDYSGTANEFKYSVLFSSETIALLEADGATAPDGATWKDYALIKGWNI